MGDGAADFCWMLTVEVPSGSSGRATRLLATSSTSGLQLQLSLCKEVQAPVFGSNRRTSRFSTRITKATSHINRCQIPREPDYHIPPVLELSPSLLMMKLLIKY